MQLAIRTLAGIVLVFVIRIELKASPDGEQATCVYFCGAPLSILTLVVHLDAGVWCGMIGVDGQRPFDLELVAIAPRECSVAPVKV